MVLIAAYLVLVGLLLGSFVNLAADRLPRGESLVAPRSHCRRCGRVLNVLDLVPVVGYAVRGGRCASCGTPIGATSPIVEAACGAAMAGAVIELGLWPGAVVGLAAVGIIGVCFTTVSYRRYRSA